jgi:DNA invertase Pin-like site-specific DNA recombinase
MSTTRTPAEVGTGDRTTGEPTAVAYLREDRHHQNPDADLADQRRDVAESAYRTGHRVVAWCVDRGEAAADRLDVRDGLADALRALRGDVAGVLIVQRLDRLADNLVAQELVAEEARRLGAEVRTVAQPGSGSENAGRSGIRDVVAAVVDHQRRLAALRLRRGRERKEREGAYPYGSPPFGFRLGDDGLAPDDDEQAVVVRMLELRAEGRSLRQIADTLGAEGHRAKRGGRWYPQTVARALHDAGEPAR